MRKRTPFWAIPFLFLGTACVLLPVLKRDEIGTREGPPARGPILVRYVEDPDMQTRCMQKVGDGIREVRPNVEVVADSSVWAPALPEVPDQPALPLEEVLEHEQVRARIDEAGIRYIVVVERAEITAEASAQGVADPRGSAIGVVWISGSSVARATIADLAHAARASAFEVEQEHGFGGAALLLAVIYVVPWDLGLTQSPCRALGELISEALPEPDDASGYAIGVLAGRSPDAFEQELAARSIEVRGEPLPSGAKAVLVGVLAKAGERSAGITHLTITETHYVIGVDPSSIQDVRKFEETLSTHDRVVRWDGPPESTTYQVEVSR